MLCIEISIINHQPEIWIIFSTQKRWINQSPLFKLSSNSSNYFYTNNPPAKNTIRKFRWFWHEFVSIVFLQPIKKNNSSIKFPALWLLELTIFIFWFLLQTVHFLDWPRLQTNFTSFCYRFSIGIKWTRKKNYFLFFLSCFLINIIRYTMAKNIFFFKCATTIEPYSFKLYIYDNSVKSVLEDIQ